ncbi:MAG: hypothetical protein J6S67_06055 [Methanobrevibacter sp.]|nr:hypothetical protein [Methanobrevibacter sp.]
MAYIVSQIKNIINDSVKDALGKTNGVTQVDTTDVVSMGKAIAQYNLYEGFFGALVNRIVRTVIFVRTYEGSNRSVLRDEHEYGAFVQKVYYTMPNAVDNPTWDIPDGNGDYKQASPYDVEGTVSISALIYGGKGTWSIEIVRPVKQIKTAFMDESSMMSFIDGIYLTVENAFKFEEERLVAQAVNTAMASVLDGGSSAQKRNLLDEYNTLYSQSLTVDTALVSADFLKYASKEINRTIENMGKMSTIYNNGGYNTFTSKDKMVVELLSEFATATDMYLQSDTFHDELTKLPNFERVPFWQSSGQTFAFDDCSKIDIDHDDLTNAVEQGGIIGFVHDIENVACYFGNRRSWEIFNPRSEVMVHGEKAEKGYAVDNNANAVVFYIATT